MSALVGKKKLASGESVGVMELTGAQAGTLYTINVRGSRLGVVSGNGEVAYELDNYTPLLTDSEIVVKNLSINDDYITVMAILTPEPSGDGGGTVIGDHIVSVDDTSRVEAIDAGVLKLRAENSGTTAVEVMLLANAGGRAVIISDGAGNPLDSSISPSGVVLHADLNNRVPASPTTGTYILQSVDGVISWVAA